jgi:tRNA A-37 threonylcarbamoyl transferase component Bud32/membrane-associated phospholipid phosphatase
MDLPADSAAHVAVPVIPTETTRPTRRPSGEPPALPHHLRTSGIGWLLATVVLVGAAMVVFSGGPSSGVAMTVTVADDAVVRWLADLDAPGVVGAFRALAAVCSGTVLSIVANALIITLVVLRRFRHLIIWLGVITVLQVGAGILLAARAHRPRPFGADIRAGWSGWAMPSLPMTLFTAGLVAILYSLVPEGRWRSAGKWVATTVVVMVGLSRVALGVDAPSDVLVGAVLGVTVPLLAFRWFTPNEVFPVSYRRGRTAHLDVEGARGQAIRRALHDQLGVTADEVTPFGLAGSAGSTPLRISVPEDPPTVLFGKLYAKSHLQADRWYKLGRELLYGQLEDERPFNTVRRLVQQEDYALSLMHRAGLPSPAPYGFVELTPEREYLLVTEFFDGAVELGDAEVDDQVIDDGLSIIRKLWDAGLAHRDIKPANLLVRDGHLLLIDVAFVEARPSPWRQAVDLANMMLCLALRSDAQVVYHRALREFSVEEITEGFAAARGLALPSQLRRMMRAQGRDLHAEFVALLPRPPRPISIQRWTARRLALLAGALVVLVLAGEVVIGQRLDPLRREGNLFLDSLSCTDPEPLWLLAQSVPAAAQVPCVPSLPAGWSLGTVTVTSGSSVLIFDHDRAGAGAMVAELTAGCDPGAAEEIGSSRPGVRRYQQTLRSATTGFDVFAGGCLTTRLVAPPGQRAELAAELPQLLGATTRERLGQLLEQRSQGRLHMDPPAGP